MVPVYPENLLINERRGGGGGGEEKINSHLKQLPGTVMVKPIFF